MCEVRECLTRVNVSAINTQTNQSLPLNPNSKSNSIYYFLRVTVTEMFHFLQLFWKNNGNNIYWFIFHIFIKNTPSIHEQESLSFVAGFKKRHEKWVRKKL